MTDNVEISYYDGGWTDITGLVRSWTVEDFGITKAPSATIQLHSDYTNLLALLTAHNKYLRVLIEPSGGSSYYRIFYGTIREPQNAKPELSHLTKLSLALDCRGLLQRLADDTITWDYYALQSATTPASAWTYAQVLADMLLVPDSGYNTGYALDIAAGDMNLVIDRAATFDNQTLLEALRTICDRTGYDGYSELNGNTPTIYLKPFGSTGSVATLTHPFLDLEYNAGSLDDIINYVLVKGGDDSGVPADGDRFTEQAISKYPIYPIWLGTTINGTVALSDLTNMAFEQPEADYGTNDYCVRAICTCTQTVLPYWFWLDFYPHFNPTSGVTYFDCLNRLTSLHFHFVCLGLNPMGMNIKSINLFLIDSAGKRIWQTLYTSDGSSTFLDGKAYYCSVKVGNTDFLASDTPYINTNTGKWVFDAGSTTFDWEHVEKVRFQVVPDTQVLGTKQWAILIDGLQFGGGLSIDPFASYAAIDDPPVKDDTSISNYGVHIQHLNDSQITSFEQAQNEGARILANVKNPIPTVTLKIPALLTAVRPSDIVTLSSIPQLNITSELWRIMTVKYEWDSTIKIIHQTLGLTKATNPLPPLWAVQPELKSFVK